MSNTSLKFKEIFACYFIYENGEAVYRKNYLNNASEYANGNAKYYHHGMLECMLLDQLDPEWKASYSFDRTLDEVIAEYVTK